MNNQNESEKPDGGGEFRRAVVSFFLSLARDAFKLVVAFAVGTGAGALVCWYYGVPMVLSLLGGILVLGLAVALTTDTWFS